MHLLIMSPARQANFRLSQSVRAVLEDVATRTGLTKTQVLELCVVRYALGIPGLADEVKQALRDVAIKHLQKAQGKD